MKSGRILKISAILFLTTYPDGIRVPVLHYSNNFIISLDIFTQCLGYLFCNLQPCVLISPGKSRNCKDAGERTGLAYYQRDYRACSDNRGRLVPITTLPLSNVVGSYVWRMEIQGSKSE